MYVPTDYLPVLIVLIFGALIGLGPFILGPFLRPRRPYGLKLSAYESGNAPSSEPRLRFSVKFYVVAMLFMIFDVEAVFLYPWAVAYDALGLYGFLEMMAFLFVLGVGYVYVWQRGGLEWD